MSKEQVFSCGGGQKQKTVHNGDASSEYYRKAAYGTCAGQYIAGYSDSL